MQAQRLQVLTALAGTDALLVQDHEMAGILRALDGRFLRPAPGGDLLRTPDILPTGRNLHGFDPFLDALPAEVASLLASRARDLGVTAGLLAQYAWHRLLARRSGDAVTLVGNVTPGRDYPIEGITASVGLYINSLPLALEWRTELTLAGQTYELCAGDSYVIDTGEPHSFSNPSGQVCRIVSAHTPASF